MIFTLIRDEPKIFKEAQSALKQAKIKGKNRVFHYRQLKKKESEKHQSSILLVDDEPLNLKLMQGLLQPLGYTLYTAKNGLDALYRLEKAEIDLVLLDVMMPDMDGFSVCRTIKANEETRLIPVVLLTSLDDVETKVQGIEAGADDFITKPPHKSELIARIKSLLRVKQLNSNLTSIENVLFSMAKSVEAKDSYTQGHVDRVSELASSIGRNMSLSENEMEALRIGGALHDVGKLGVPEEILNKPGPLDNGEWTVMKTHPEIGYKICLPLKKNLGQALDIVRHHHEKLDGSGYPDGLKADEILMVTRIMTVADIFDALTSDRPYRKAMSTVKATQILLKEAQKGKIDSVVTRCLLQLMSNQNITNDADKLNSVHPEIGKLG
ncbi:HD-GYP domain-containing protein [Desulfosarcina ovata]|uniref:Two-component system response regulator n=1 Tax=Desulfosarcina ovata subsp. ovata TaxID=2752305 RepID=A0A5K8AA79_9BACT|nr:HD domain-containing phosphohydrolase [Desulfosarcina ovata]BBO89368.1 two-component system response regulator [Desulfosarcina ovata subsp. ovata]